MKTKQIIKFIISLPYLGNACFFLIVLGLSFIPYAEANEPLDQSSRFTISGFGTLGVVHSDSSQLGFYRDLIQEDGVFDGDLSLSTDSLLGLQLDVEFTNALNATMQVVLKDRVNNDDDFDERILEQAFLHYRYKPNVSIRLGRLPVDTYMLADYRNVGFAYLWARPPTEFYGRIPFTSFDGIDVTCAKRLATGTFKVKLYGGSAGIVMPLDEGLDPWEFDLEPLVGFNLGFETKQWNLRAGYVYSTSDSGLPPADQLRQTLALVPSFAWPEKSQIEDDLDIEGQSVSYYSLGVSFDNNIWLLQSEVAYMDSQLSITPSEIDAYLSIGRRIHTFTPYIMVSMAEPMDEIRTVSTPLDPSLIPLQSAVYQMFNVNRVEQKSLAVGVKWDFHPKANLKLQLQRTWVEGDGSRLWENVDFDGRDETVDTFSFNINFIF